MRHNHAAKEFLFCVAAILICAMFTQAGYADSPPPQRGVQVDVHRQWLDASTYEHNTPPNIHGFNIARPDMVHGDPRIDLLENNAKTMWVLRLAIPIDAKLFPIITFKYRAHNVGQQGTYVLRLVHGTGADRAAVKFLTPSDLQGDEKVHELTADLRDKQVEDTISEVGVSLCSDEKPAWLDIVGVSFSAPPDSTPPKVADASEVKIKVTCDGKPLAGARVTVDAERMNFARSAQADDQGEVSIKPAGNEAHVHTARVEKIGYLTVDRIIDGAVSEIKTAPAVRYGGVALNESGAVAADAQITVRAKPEFLRDLGLPTSALAVVTTDDGGHWTTAPLPADAGVLTIQCKTAAAGAEPVTNELEAGKFKTPAEPWPMSTLAPAGLAGAAAPATAPSPPTTHPATQPTAAAPTTSASAARQSAKQAAEPITAILQKVDDTTTGVGWTGVEGDQLLVVLHPQPGKDEPAKIPLAEVTELVLKRPSFSTTPAPATAPSTKPVSVLANARVLLTGDDRLSGLVTGWADKQLTVQSNLSPAESIQIPVTSLRQLWCGNADLVKKAQALKEESAVEDIAFAVKDDDVIAVHGIAVGIQGESLLFRFGNEDRKIGLNRLVGLIMAGAQDTPPDDSMYSSVQFINDDQLSGTLGRIAGKSLVMQTRSGAAVQVPVDQIARISTRNGRLVYLSDLKPAAVEQTPYFDHLMEYRVDKSLNGKPITLMDGTYPHGICVHSRCVLTYHLDARFTDFRGKVGFALPEGKAGQAVIRVLGDGKPLYENLDARGDQPPADLKLKVSSVRELKLEVDYGKNDDTADRIAWANARLIRAEIPQ